MPSLSLFYGITIYMYCEKGGRHKVPHIHAVFSGEEVAIDLNGEIIEGSIPANKMKLVLAWMEIHREDLEANWRLLSNGEQHYRIDPLK